MFHVGRVGFVGQQYGSVGGPAFSTNFTNGTLPAGYTFSRASSGTYYDVAGVLQTAATDVPRFDYDPITHVASGILIEDARTNYLLNSAVPATQVTGSLPTGTYTLWLDGTGSATSAAVTAVGSGFGAATAGSPNVITITTAGTISVTVVGTPTRFQLENGAFLTSFIETTAATATRARDILNMPLGAWFNPVEGTAMVEAAIRGPGAGALTPPAFSMDATIAGNNSKLQIRTDSAGVMAGRFLSGVTSVAPMGSSISWGNNTFRKGAVAYLSGSSNGSYSGNIGADVVTAFAPLTNYTTLRFGVDSNGTAAPFSGWIRNFAYYNTRMSNAALQALTL